MSGSNPSSATVASGSYGTQGVTSASNVPGARQNAVSWTDSSGNLWLFGGEGYAANGTSGDLNDLWEYSPSAKTWTWVSGSDTANASSVYGTQGVASASNVPGARDSAASWTDASGNLWLFGGGNGSDVNGCGGELNDLWEYSPSAKTWTWVSGGGSACATGVFGTQGVASASNVPGVRSGAVSWTDSSGNLWLFGGYSTANGTGEDFNDLWEFSPTTKEWTWMSGSSAANQPGVYGTQGVASASNVPGARDSAVSWTDRTGNVWLYGGGGFDANGTVEYFNDLWEFNTTTKEWTWVGGSSTVNQPAVYGTQGVASASNTPGGRGSAVGWTDSSGNFWLFGGEGSAVSGGIWPHDLWEYSPSAKTWTWVSGSNTTNASGSYGTQGVASTGNVPGARDSAVGWTDSSGNFWLFGGYSYFAWGQPVEYHDLNDLWEYQP